MTKDLDATRALSASRTGIRDVALLCGAPARLEILIALAQAPCEVGVLATALCRDITCVSHQLKPLRDGALVRATRHRNRVVYTLTAAVEVEDTPSTLALTVRATDGSSVRYSVPRSATPPGTHTATPDAASEGA